MIREEHHGYRSGESRSTFTQPLRKQLIAIPIMVFALMSPHLFAQSGQATVEELKALRRDIDALQAGQKAMQKTLEVMKDILMGKQPPLENVFVNVDGARVLGEKTARVTMVEFSDYQCPFCGNFATTTFNPLVDEYVKSGKVLYVLRNFPLEGMHPLAEKAAEAAECMGDQGKYWEAHERLFNNQKAIDARELPAHALFLGLDLPKFQQCLDSGTYTSKVKADIAEGMKLNVRGTPTFFFGYMDPKDPKRMLAVELLSGAQPIQMFKDVIERLLNPPQNSETKR
jgi:protein-disulfide isomerase